MTEENKLDRIAALLKVELKKARIQKSNNYLRVSSAKDDLDMSKLLNSDDTSELEALFKTI